jgi:hypothetical protein
LYFGNNATFQVTNGDEKKSKNLKDNSVRDSVLCMKPDMESGMVSKSLDQNSAYLFSKALVEEII